MNDKDYLQKAITEAKRALSHNDVPIGAIIVKDGLIIGRGHNRRELESDPTAHAEIMALRAAGAYIGNWDLSGCTLYVTHEPCPMCAGALVMARVDTVVYGCQEPVSGVCGSIMNLVQFPDFQHNVRIRGPLLQTECANLTHAFFRQLREQNKNEQDRQK